MHDPSIYASSLPSEEIKTISLDIQGIVQGSKAKAYDNLKHEVITTESPHPRQRWVKVVTMVTTLHFWSKKPEPPCPQGTLDDFEIADVPMDNIWAEFESEYPFSFGPNY